MYSNEDYTAKKAWNEEIKYAIHVWNARVYCLIKRKVFGFTTGPKDALTLITPRKTLKKGGFF